MATSSQDVVEFAVSINSEILEFLKNHTLPKKIRRSVSLSNSPSLIEENNPELYKKMLRRASLPDEETDRLLQYLMSHHREYLASTHEVMEHTERLEDVVDFILDKVS